MKRWQMFMIFITALVLANIACGGQSNIQPISFANTPTSVPTEALATQTPFFVEITTTPLPTLSPTEVLAKCVKADVLVHLRPSPNTSGYPIEVLANGRQVVDLGGRVGKWWFVSVGKNQGWVDSNYLGEC